MVAEDDAAAWPCVSPPVNANNPPTHLRCFGVARNPPTPSSFAKATEDKWLRRGNPPTPSGCGAVKKGKHTVKSKTKNKLVAFVKEAIRAAVAAIMGG